MTRLGSAGFRLVVSRIDSVSRDLISQLHKIIKVISLRGRMEFTSGIRSTKNDRNVLSWSIMKRSRRDIWIAAVKVLVVRLQRCPSETEND